jgi:cell division protein FtsL
VTQATSRASAQSAPAAYRRVGGHAHARRLEEAHPRSWLRVVAPSRRTRRAPFVILLATVVVGGVLGLVSLSIAVNQQAFALAELERANQDLTVRHSTLRADVDRLSAPDRVERIAKRRGLEPVRSARIAAWPGAAAATGSAKGGAAATAGPAATPPASADGRLWTVEDPHPIKHYLAQP